MMASACSILFALSGRMHDPPVADARVENPCHGEPNMSHRIFNFSAGPAMLPTEVLEKSAKALVDYEGKGFGIAEVSHRGKEFEAVNDEAMSRCKKLLNLGDSHDVIFLQGGATMLFTTIPMNFLHGAGDYLVGGEWSKKAAGAAKDLGKVN